MTKDTKKLIEAFTVKGEIEGFVANLEQLKADGSITEEQYATMKAEYEQNLNAATLEVSRIKNELKKQLEATQRDIETYKFELGKLEAKYKVGELPLEKYQSSDRKLRASIEGLEVKAEEMERLIGAESSADIGVPTKKPGVAVPQLPSLPRPTSIRGTKLSKRLLVIVGGAVALIAIIVVAILLMTGGAKEVRVPIEVQDAANVGSLHLELVYDRATLSAIHVETGTAVGDAMFQYSVDAPGGVVVGIVSSQGINRDGSIAIVTFKVTGKSKASTYLSLENVVAHDATTLEEIPTSTTAGSITAKDGSFTSPTLLFEAEVTE